MSRPDEEAKDAPAPEEESPEDRGLWFLGLDHALKKEQSSRRPDRLGGPETAGGASAASADDEHYWFSTFLESSVRQREQYDQTVESGPMVSDISTSPLARELSPAEDLVAPSLKAPSLYEHGRRSLEATFASLQSNKPVDPELLEDLADQMVSSIVLSSPDSYDFRSPLFPRTLYYYLLESVGRPYDAVEHSLNVAIHGVIFSRERGASREELRRLCAAALLHEVGMLLLPPAVWDHPRPLTETEWATIKYHAELGQERVSSLGGSLAEAARVIGQEHERADGSGYPHGLKSDEIDEFAKIIAIVDVFDALTHGRPHRPPCTPHQALRAILEGMREGFDHGLLKSFLRLMTVFPLGSYVELGTGEVARVVRVDGRSPLRPAVEVVLNAQGHPLAEPRFFELSSDPEASVSRCLGGFYFPIEGPLASGPTGMVE